MHEFARFAKKQLFIRITPNLLSILNLNRISKCSPSHRSAFFTSHPHVSERHFLIPTVKIKSCLFFKVEESFALSHNLLCTCVFPS